MTARGGHRAAALLDGAAFVLVLAAAVALALGLLTGASAGPAAIALIASLGGLLLLGLAVVRSSGAPPS